MYKKSLKNYDNLSGVVIIFFADNAYYVKIILSENLAMLFLCHYIVIISIKNLDAS